MESEWPVCKENSLAVLPCSGKVFETKNCYSHHRTASFNPLIHIVNLRGDVHRQPGPTKKSNNGAITSAIQTKRVAACCTKVEGICKNSACG